MRPRSLRGWTILWVLTAGAIVFLGAMEEAFDTCCMPTGEQPEVSPVLVARVSQILPLIIAASVIAGAFLSKHRFQPWVGIAAATVISAFVLLFHKIVAFICLVESY